MSDSSSESQHCIVCEDKCNDFLEIAEIQELMVITSLQGNFNKNVQPSDIICSLCVGSIESKGEKFQQSDNNERKMKSSTVQGIYQSLKNAGQASSPWNTVIVNQLPIEITREELISLFSQYGEIEDTYLCKRVDPNGSNAHKPERVARITFTNEDDAWEVFEAFQRKLIKYNNEELMMTVVSEDFSPIQSLSEECLLEIFSRIPLVSDKFTVEMVCKQWKEIGRRSWASVTRVGEYWPSATFRVIATRAGDSLRDIKVTLPAISSANPAADLEDMNKSLISVVGYCFERLMISLDIPRLPSVSQVFRQTYIPAVAGIVFVNRCLKRLSLEWVECDPHFIKLFPADIEEIHLSPYVMSQPLNVEPGEFSRFRKLQALTLFCFDLSEDRLKGIERLENLKVLNLHKCRVLHSNIRNIVDFKKLEYLAIPDCGISDVILSRILQNNKGLKELDISGNTEITNESIQYVCTLEYLQFLRIQGLHQVTDVNLTGMTALRTLDCTGCSAITDESIQRLFASSSVIFDLFISGCSVTMECIKTAMKWTSQTAKPLVIFVDQNLYDQWEVFARKQFELYALEDSDDPTAVKSNRISPNFHVARYQIPDVLWPSQNDWDDYHLVNDDHKWCHINCQRVP